MAIDISHDVDRLRSEIDEMRKDMKTMSRAMRDIGAEKGQEALDHLGHFTKRARKQAARTEARLEHGIEERPIVSVVAAFGIGFLVAKLFDSSR